MAYSHRVQFYETDLMGIVHHSNYLRVYEEARVAWAHQHGILDYQKPDSASHLAVLQTEVRHIKPARFGDILQIELQVKLAAAKIIFEYKMYKDNDLQHGGELISEARTTHVALNHELQVIKPPVIFKAAMEKEKWIETWLLSL